MNIKRLLPLLVWFASLLPANAQHTQKSAESEQLGRAIEYFSSGKYHEALLIFQKLDKEYDLNPRFKAYIGVCYYYEWDYEKATTYLDAVMQDMEVYAPHERSFYYFSDAESHFNLGHYRECIPLFEQHLQVCYNNEKGDAYYRIAFSYMFLEEWENAADNFRSALSYYRQYRDTPELLARITQIEKMTKGIDDKIAAIKAELQQEQEQESIQEQEPETKQEQEPDPEVEIGQKSISASEQEPDPIIEITE